MIDYFEKVSKSVHNYDLPLYKSTTSYGRLAQLVAHLNDIQGVTSSSLVSPTILDKTPSNIGLKVFFYKNKIKY